MPDGNDNSIRAYRGVLPSNPRQTLHAPKGAVTLADAVGSTECIQGC